MLDQSCIKDLRTNYEVGNTQAVLDGDLDDFISASLKQECEVNDEPPRDDNQVIAERRGKLAELRAAGSAYPNDFRCDALAAPARRIRCKGECRARSGRASALPSPAE